MLTREAAERFLVRIETVVGNDLELDELEKDLIHAAVNYARIRTDWELNPPSKSDVESREARGAHRTHSHNDFIVACDVLARAMQQRGLDSAWRAELGQDRKQIGDWACYLHCLLGLRAR